MQEGCCASKNSGFAWSIHHWAKKLVRQKILASQYILAGLTDFQKKNLATKDAVGLFTTRSQVGYLKIVT
jgi:hypothetical protein